jgi:hypothetical protein
VGSLLQKLVIECVGGTWDWMLEHMGVDVGHQGEVWLGVIRRGFVWGVVRALGF